MSLWVLVVLGSIPVVVLAVARNEAQRSRLRSATVLLEVDTSGVRRTLADDRHEELLWSELRVVEVVRAKWGPHAHSGGVVLLGGAGTAGVLLPIDQLGSSGVVEHLAALPGFDMEAFTDALDAKAPARIAIWGSDDPAS